MGFSVVLQTVCRRFSLVSLPFLFDLIFGPIVDGHDGFYPSFSEKHLYVHVLIYCQRKKSRQ